ncbi:SDR family NAD(P)-dependent oxidoreductase [Pseudoruegeria sp. SHC-113]|uniref:SDR family NAD(P)-dependent oxidoreductase n=1 Tax=Pseudoruegeria sp. SHC-113 TaxID=2855439 RepID=UPI0021BAB0A9|nr:SDR family NAD(P)-dependent oxidoreductase [Pseudoruegeria sp. SHC-113]MCT8161532.1 SDR family NAD(P)-dependent oxidoreductase [Pseudoruegeria sp. SHC-113]
MEQGKLALVTGASRGIGSGVAERLAAEGYRVIRVARQAGSGPDDLAVDLTAPGAPAVIAERLSRIGQPLDLLIHNAGQQGAVDLDAPPERAVWAQEMALNLAAPVALTMALLPVMRRPGGVIAFTTSLVALYAKPSAPVYSASKAGLAAFARAARHQLEGRGLQVVEIVPPLVATAMTEGRRGTMHVDAAARQICAGLARGDRVIAPGKARAVRRLHRVLPGAVERILART